MKLLLHEDIPKLGYFGDVVEVKDGYARNCLIPQGLAVEPSEENIKAIEHEKARKAAERRMAMEELQKTCEAVAGQTVLIKALANDMGHLFGSVTEKDIAQALQEKAFAVQNKHVQLGEHLRMVGDHTVKLRFAEDIETEITVKIMRPEDEADGSEVTAAEESDGTDESETGAAEEQSAG